MEEYKPKLPNWFYQVKLWTKELQLLALTWGSIFYAMFTALDTEKSKKIIVEALNLNVYSAILACLWISTIISLSFGGSRVIKGVIQKLKIENNE